MSIPKAAKYLGVGRDLMYELVKSGQIRSFKVGNRSLVPRTSCDEWLQGQLDAASKEPSGAQL